ncbi:MAG: hypothetical protein NXI24_06530 [bacterium]|nr:hypothetical protein [bacterium]
MSAQVPEEREEKNAAIFDFDGVLYSSSARWKIIDARLGVVGSRVAWEAGLRMYDQASQKFPGLQLNECFAPDEFEFAVLRDHANLTLPRHLMKTAQNHIFRGHDLFVLSRYSFRDFLRVNERFMGQPGPLPLKGNPFEHSRLLVTEDYSAAHGNTGASLNQKFRRIVSMLELNRDTEETHPPSDDRDPAGAPDSAIADQGADDSAPETGMYSRVFLYYTETGYPDLADQFLRSTMDDLAGGRNAIVVSYIADVPE